MRGNARFWEDFAAGDRFVTEWRVITGSDIDAFAALSGDLNPLHRDDAVARRAGFGGRIAQGALGLAVATGLLNSSGVTAGTLIAFVGLSWDFQRPLYPDTEVVLRLNVRETRPTRRADRGILVLSGELAGRDGVVHQSGDLKFLVRRRAAVTRSQSDLTD
jgi:acyl dehydratase